VELRLSGRLPDGRRGRAAAPGEDRGRPGEPAADPDRSGRGLPAREGVAVHRPVAPPRRLRRRLTVAVVLVAGLSAGALALGSFLLVRRARLQDSLDRAKAEATLDLRQAAGLKRNS